MSRLAGAAWALAAVVITAHAVADDSEEHDPVRDAQRMRDCIAEQVAKNDGRSQEQIKRECERLIADRSYRDPNIGLDGMIKQPR